MNKGKSLSAGFPNATPGQGGSVIFFNMLQKMRDEGRILEGFDIEYLS